MKALSSVRAWVLLAAAILAPIAAVSVSQLNAQPNAVLLAGDDNGGQGGG